jgi:acyl carrier protein
VETKLHTLIADTLHLPLEKINNDLTMKEVESWDSLQHMNLVASLEQIFGVEFTFEEIVTMQSVAQIKDVLKAKGADA